MRIFRKGAGPHALAEAMTGVRLGTRLLYAGDGHPALFAALAAKAGLTGRALALAGNEAAGGRITNASARAGVLVEVAVMSRPEWSVEPAAFDVAVIDATGGTVLAADREFREALARRLLGSLQPHGRVIVVERERRGLVRLLRGQPAGLDQFRAAGGAEGLLTGSGFRPVRLLADRDGQRFTEGWVPAAG